MYENNFSLCIYNHGIRLFWFYTKSQTEIEALSSSNQHKTTSSTTLTVKQKHLKWVDKWVQQDGGAGGGVASLTISRIAHGNFVTASTVGSIKSSFRITLEEWWTVKRGGGDFFPIAKQRNSLPWL